MYGLETIKKLNEDAVKKEENKPKFACNCKARYGRKSCKCAACFKDRLERLHDDV